MTVFMIDGDGSHGDPCLIFTHYKLKENNISVEYLGNIYIHHINLKKIVR